MSQYAINPSVSPDSAFIDAFGRSRVSTPFTVFDSKQVFDTQPLIWNNSLSGAGVTATYNANQASTTLAIAATTGTAIRQTYRRFQYQPGKSQLIFMTGVLGVPVTNATKRLGYFDDNNGLFFELANSTLRVVRRTNVTGTPVDNPINQSAWNLDKLDGTGSSKVSLNPALTQIFVIDFEWLGVGRIRFGIVLGGVIIYCHEILNANVLNVVYMSTPNLPIRYEVRTSASASASITHICASVQSEGGLEPGGYQFSVDRGATPTVTGNDTNIYPLIAIQLKAAYLGATVNILTANVLATTNASIRWMILLDPIVAGVVFNMVSVTNSAIEADVARLNTTTLTGGTLLASGYVQQNTDANLNIIRPTDLTLGATIAGVANVIVLAIQRLGSTAETVYGALGWRELL
jgi:hypothetical protein